MSKVVFIGAGPGDPELITIKGKKNLEKADVIIYTGSLLNPEILRYAKPDAEFYDSAAMDLAEVLKVMVDTVRKGRVVVRVHDGDPSFFGAITEQMDFLEKEKITYEVIPGVSCLQGGAATLKRELTLPNVSQSVIITRPEGRTLVPESEGIRELAKHGTTMVIFLGIQQLDKVARELVEGGRPKDTPVAVVYKATWKDEKIVRGTLSNIVGKVKEAGIRKTALIFVGEVLKPKSYDYSKLYDPTFTHSYRKDESKGRNGGRGRIVVVGIGPGALEHLTIIAKQEIKNAEVIIGYRTYLNLIEPIIKGDIEVISGKMGQEVKRARTAVMKALENKRVVVVSSGDPGIYGMAGLVLEVAEQEKVSIPIEVVPGVTAANAAAATLGAPLIGDFAVVSLSDLLTSWDLIERRLRSVAEADFVIVLYNPQSKGRRNPLAKAHEILLEYRDPDTLVGIVKRAQRDGEETTITSLKEMLNHEIDMVTIIIIGNSTTYTANGKLVTPRGYNLSC